MVLHPIAHSCRGATACTNTLCSRLTKQTAGSSESKREMDEEENLSFYSTRFSILPVRFHFIFGCNIRRIRTNSGNVYNWILCKLDITMPIFNWKKPRLYDASKGLYEKRKCTCNVKRPKRKWAKQKMKETARRVVACSKGFTAHAAFQPLKDSASVWQSRYRANKSTNVSWSLDRLNQSLKIVGSCSSNLFASKAIVQKLSNKTPESTQSSDTVSLDNFITN